LKRITVRIRSIPAEWRATVREGRTRRHSVRGRTLLAHEWCGGSSCKSLIQKMVASMDGPARRPVPGLLYWEA
jgi:hypothetical protein